MLFAINFLTTKVVLSELNPVIFSFYRFFLSAIVIGLYLVFKRFKFKIKDSSILKKLILVAFAIPLSQTVFITGLKYTTPANTSLLSTTIPVFTLFIAVIRKQIPRTLGIVAGFILALVGTIIYKDFSQFTLSSVAFKGDLYVISGCIFFAMSISLSKDVMSKVTPILATFYIFLLGSLILIPINFLVYPGAIQYPELSNEHILWNFLFSVFGGTLLTYFLNNHIIRRLSPDVVSLGIYLQPIFAGFLSWYYMGENITWRIFVSLSFIFTGVYIITRSHKKEAKGMPTDKP